MIKLLYTITGLYRGGAETMLYKLLCCIDRQKYSPIVISLFDDGDYGAKINELNIPVYSLGMPRGVPTPIDLWRLRSLIRKLDPDIVHAWMYHAGLATLLACGNIPCIVGIRSGAANLMAEKWLTRYVIKALGKAIHKANAVVFCSHKSMEQHAVLGYDRASNFLIPNGFDCEYLQPLAEMRAAMRKNLDITHGAFVVGHVGRFHPVKDHDNLLNAFAELSKLRKDVRLVMAGGGLDEGNPYLTNMLDALGIKGEVNLLGLRDDISNLMNTFDVLVNSSRSEAFPNVLGEAMACGIPCIATDVGDSSFIVGDTGLVVPSQDPHALADAMGQFYAMSMDDRYSLGHKARQRILDKFSLSMIVRQYESLYEQHV